VFDTDQKRFGGQGRIADDQPYPLIAETHGNECCLVVRVYLPCRTALVLQREQ
jgi:hypothetical protein